MSSAGRSDRSGDDDSIGELGGAKFGEREKKYVGVLFAVSCHAHVMLC